MAKGFKSIIYAGEDILYTECDQTKNNSIMAQLGDATLDQQNTTGEDLSEWWQHIGFASRPSPVSGTGKSSDAAQAITINRSDHDIVIASRDVRSQGIYGALKPGETCLYATGKDGKGQPRILLKQDGSINLFTRKSNVESGVGMGLFISASGDSITAMNSTGAALQLTSAGSTLLSKDGAVAIASGSLKIASKGTVNISGTNVVLGGASAQPVLNTVDLASLITALTAAFGAITVPGGGPAVAAAWSAASAAVLAAAQIKRTSVE